jgi:hypothetical protein
LEVEERERIIMKKYSLRILQMAYLGALKKDDYYELCHICWKPLVNNKCKECGVEKNIEKDSFLALDGYELQF